MSASLKDRIDANAMERLVAAAAIKLAVAFKTTPHEIAAACGPDGGLVSRSVMNHVRKTKRGKSRT